MSDGQMRTSVEIDDAKRMPARLVDDGHRGRKLEICRARRLAMMRGAVIGVQW